MQTEYEKMPKTRKKFTKEYLLVDFNRLERISKEFKTLFTPEDGFIIGYLCGKYNLDRLEYEKGWLRDAIEKYDETDDLALYDTIGRLFIKLGELSD